MSFEIFPPPKENLALIGHQLTQKYFLDTFRKGRPPHAWLFSGPKGVGKATFAYRAATFLLSPFEGGYPEAFPPLFDETPVSRQIAQGVHPDLLVIERSEEEESSQFISVEAIRKIPGFIQKTPSLGQWKIVIIDSADDMNINGANALLKSLEEPPSYVLFFLISHTAGRLLDTIRSRCHLLSFSPLQEEGREFFPDASKASIDFANGSFGEICRFSRLKGDEVLDLLWDAITGLTQGPSGYQKSYELIRFVLNLSHEDKLSFFADLLSWWLHRASKYIFHRSSLADFLTEKEKNLLNHLAKPTNIRNYLEARTQIEDLFKDQKSLNQDPKLTLINSMITLETYLKP